MQSVYKGLQLRRLHGGKVVPGQRLAGADGVGSAQACLPQLCPEGMSPAQIARGALDQQAGGLGGVGEEVGAAHLQQTRCNQGIEQYLQPIRFNPQSRPGLGSAQRAILEAGEHLQAQAGQQGKRGIYIQQALDGHRNKRVAGHGIERGGLNLLVELFSFY